jgi:hypothetical protein
MGFSPESYTFMTMGRTSICPLLKELRVETVFGLNFIKLSKVLKNPLGCCRSLSPFLKGILLRRAAEQLSNRAV